MSQSAEKPLSPHLQVYRWQLTMVTSIAHRASGMCLSLGAAVLAIWLMAAAIGGDVFAAVNSQLGAWYGQVLLFAWTFALFYHLCNGIRHLGWDTGWGLGLKTAYTTGYITLAAAAVLTVLAWLFALI